MVESTKSLIELITELGKNFQEQEEDRKKERSAQEQLHKLAQSLLNELKLAQEKNKELENQINKLRKEIEGSQVFPSHPSSLLNKIEGPICDESKASLEAEKNPDQSKQSLKSKAKILIFFVAFTLFQISSNALANNWDTTTIVMQIVTFAVLLISLGALTILGVGELNQLKG